MKAHPLQGCLDNLVEYSRDARNLVYVTDELLAQQVSTRRQLGTTGGGRPSGTHWPSLHRAAVVASVGAWEAFVEDLAEAGLTARPQRRPVNPKWAPIGDWLQTPNSNNVRKALWTLFDFDPELVWNVQVVTAPAETGGAVGWRKDRRVHTAADASRFLDLMLSVRHGFAHQDLQATTTVNAKGNRRDHLQALPGMATELNQHKLTVQSHQAKNALSAVLQLAVHTVNGMSTHLHLGSRMRWTAAMTKADWAWWLDGPARGSDKPPTESLALATIRAANWRGVERME